MDAKKLVSKFSKEYLKEIFSLSKKCSSFEHGDDVFRFEGSLLDSVIVIDLFDIAKRVEDEWNDVKVEKLDFTEAQQDYIGKDVPDEEQVLATKKLKNT